ncbi:MAG TPA: AmmeMemoRadiSam system radical SAM enzyme [Bacteroidota bacterium]|nr:AmmeMemoRadiSam system radical SAM enzyme [Bacteroidota bacterium]
MDTMTKREFLRICCYGAGTCLLGTVKGAATSMWSTFPAGPGGPVRPGGDDGPGKWSKEALFYTVSPEGLHCHKCPHGCVLGEGESGICRNRVNYGGKLYSIAYGNPCAVQIDPIEKKPLFHFLPSTRAFSIAAAGCNLRCLNCQNWEISQKSPRETENADLMPDRVVAACAAAGCASIAYTYSEPVTFYEYACDTAAIARKRGIRNIWKSSGYINEEPLRRLCRFMDAANIDLKGFDDDIYLKLNSARLAPVLRTLEVFREEGVWLEITNLVVPTWTDDLDVIRKMCDWLATHGLQDAPLHFSRFTPLYKLSQLAPTPVSTLEKAHAIALQAGLRYVYIGNVPGHDAENTYCPRCGTLAVERRGFTVLTMAIRNGRCPKCGEKIPGVWTNEL